MNPATLAGLDDRRVLAWAEQHADPRIREVAERWADVLAELDEALQRAERAELLADEACERVQQLERARAELEAQLAPPDPE